MNFSISTRIILMVCFVLFPSMLLIIFSDFTDINRRKSDLYNQMSDLSKSISDLQILNIENHERFLKNLSNYPLSKNLKQPEYDKFLQELIIQNNQYNNIIVLDSTGNIRANANPILDKRKLRERSYLNEVIKTKEFQISDMIFYEESDQISVPFAFPVIKNKKIENIFIIGCYPASVFKLPNILHLPKGSIILLLDRNGHIVNKKSEKNMIGTKIDYHLLEQVLKAKSQPSIFKSNQYDQTKRTFFCQPISYSINSPDFYLLIGVTDDYTLSGIYKNLVFHITIFFILLLFTLTIAYFSGKILFYDNVKDLISYAEDLRDGNYDQGVISDHFSGEFSTLFNSLDSMKQAIKEREKKLLDSQKLLISKEEFMQSLLRNLSGLVFKVKNDLTRSIEFFTTGIYELTGFEVDDFLTNKIHFSKLIKPEYKDQLWITQQNAIVQRSFYELEYEIITKDNQSKWVLEKGCGIYNENNEALSIIGFVTDISPLKIAELATREHKLKLSKMIELSPVGIITIDSEENIIEINHTCLKLLHYQDNYRPFTIPNLIKHIRNIDPKSDLINLFSKICKIRTNVINKPYQFTIKDRMFHFSISTAPVFDEQGEFQNHIITIDDMSEQILNQEKIISQEKIFHSLFDNMAEGVCLHEMILGDNDQFTNYKIIDMNPSYMNILSLKREDVINKYGNEAYGTEIAPYLQEYSDVVINNKTIQIEVYFEPMKKYFNISAVPIDNIKFATIFSDSTIQKFHTMEMERLLRELKQKNSDLENIISISSHDLKSPLVNIQGYSGMLSNQCKQLVHLSLPYLEKDLFNDEYFEIIKEKIPKSLKHITENTFKINNLLDALLKLTRSNRIELVCKQINMNELITNVVTRYHYQFSEIKAEVKINDLCPCYGDFSLISQVFINIFDNALKYRNIHKLLELEISSGQEEEFSLYIIKDNGIGIEEDQKKGIFDLFYQIHNSESGNGLGLTISQNIIQKHNGYICVNSNIGEGSEFIIRLPKLYFKEVL